MRVVGWRFGGVDVRPPLRLASCTLGLPDLMRLRLRTEQSACGCLAGRDIGLVVIVPLGQGC